MTRFEYKVVPAPRRGEKARGVKTTEERFALALTGLMNRLGAEGWDYVRADALPCEERVGLTGSKTSFQNMLVFRRNLDADVQESGTPPSVLRIAHDTGPDATPATAIKAPSLRLGSAEPPTGAAPALGPAKASPAKADLAAE